MEEDSCLDKILELPAGVRALIAQKAHLDFMTRLYPVTPSTRMKSIRGSLRKNLEWKLAILSSSRYQKINLFKADPQKHYDLAMLLKGVYNREFLRNFSKENGYGVFIVDDDYTDLLYGYRYADYLCSQGMSMELWYLLVSRGLWFEEK